MPAARARCRVSANGGGRHGSDLKTTRRTVTVKTLNVSMVTLPKTKPSTWATPIPLAGSWRRPSPRRWWARICSARTSTPATGRDVAEVDPPPRADAEKKRRHLRHRHRRRQKQANRCKVTVAQKAIKSVSVTTPEDAPVVLDPGETAQLKSVATPSYAYDRGVKWFSDRPGVATVDEGTGLVKAVSGGAATITCQSSANPRVKATVKGHVRGRGCMTPSPSPRRRRGAGRRKRSGARRCRTPNPTRPYGQW
jgi:uncharacterized protein YjdB